MSFGKRIMQSEITHRILARTASSYVKFVAFTCRFQVRNSHVAENFWKAEDTFIVTTWHGQNLLMPPFWHNWRIIKTLVSMHGDGQLLARFLENMGFTTIRGSGVPKGEEKRAKNKNKRGAIALREMVRALRADASIFMTSDMPPGPARIAGPGIVALARLSGRPIVPVALSTKWRITMGNWSKLKINLPFSRGGIVWGDPIYVPGDADAAMLEVCRQQVEKALNEVNAEADLLAGLPVDTNQAGADL